MREGAADPVGERLGDFELLEVVRKRHGSTTYRANTGQNDVDVTVLPQTADPTLRGHTLASVRRVARLRHPNIVPIEDVGVADERVYFVTAHTSVRPTLGDLDAPLAPGRAVGLLAPLLEALQYAHDRGVVHADLTPRRVVLPSPTWPMLTDFLIDTAPRDAQTDAGRRLVLGTPAYLAPEQAFGLPARAAADVYSLAVVGYELVTGRVPFAADTPEAVLRMQAYEPPPPARRFVADLPDRLDDALLAALSKDPAQRPTASSLAEALQEAVAHESSAPALTSSEPVETDERASHYAAGVQAFADARWADAVLLLGAIADHDPGFEDVEVLLHAARQALAQGGD